MERDPLAYAVIGHAMAVHREIGPGVDEVFYHQALADRLEADGIEHLTKPRQALEHRGSTADVFEPDFVPVVGSAPRFGAGGTAGAPVDCRHDTRRDLGDQAPPLPPCADTSLSTSKTLKENGRMAVEGACRFYSSGGGLETPPRQLPTVPNLE